MQAGYIYRHYQSLTALDALWIGGIATAVFEFPMDAS